MRGWGVCTSVECSFHLEVRWDLESGVSAGKEELAPSKLLNRVWGSEGGRGKVTCRPLPHAVTGSALAAALYGSAGTLSLLTWGSP